MLCLIQIVTLLSASGLFEAALPTQEHLLYRKLMRHYEPSVRPVLHHNSILNIHFKMKLTQVLELSEKDQTLVTNIWIEQQWPDEFLKWNSSIYSGIRSLRMPSNKIWLPDTYIYNSASTQDSLQGTITGPYVMVNSDGIVRFPVPMKLKSNCEVDIAYFPFDQQICYIKFASWIHDLSAINFSTFENNNFLVRSSKSVSYQKQQEKLSLLNSNVDLSSYVDNSGWILMNVSFLRRERNQTNGIHPELIYFIHIKRRNLYYVFNVIIPCAMLSVLTCMSFWLPCLSGEKITVGLTCFVAYSVFMLMVAEKVPTTSETVPIISIYLTIVMSFTSISVIMAVVVTNIHEKTKNCNSKENRMPKLMRKIFINRLAKFFGMQKQAKDLLKLMIKLEKKNDEKSSLKINNSDNGTMLSSGNDMRHTKLYDMIAKDFVQRKDTNNLKWDCDSHRDCCLKKSERLLDINNCTCEFHATKKFQINGTVLLTDNKVESMRKLNGQNVKCASRKHEMNQSEVWLRKHDSKNENFKILTRKVKKSKRLETSLKKRENMSLYFAYEYVLVGLVLDRLFFWLYTCFTLLSYIITLYIFPYQVQTNKSDYMKDIP